MLTTQAAVERVLRRELNPAEADSLEQLDNEARFLIEGYTGETYDENFPLDIPAEVTTVANRIIVRALRSDPTLEGVQSHQKTTGPFSQSTTYVQGGGGMYLGKAEKEMLKRRRKSLSVLNLGNY